MNEFIERELEELNLKKLSNRRIAVMGRLEHGSEIIHWLGAHGIMVDSVLDNDANKQGGTLNGVKIQSPQRFAQSGDQKACILIYSPKYWEQMLDQLIGLGFADRKEIVVLDRPSLRKNLKLVRRGMWLYRQLQTEHGKNVQIFLANCPIGDYYLLGLFFHQYCRKHQITNYVVIGESKGIKKLSGLLKICPVRNITPEDSQALLRAWIFTGKQMKLKVLTIWQGAFRLNPPITRQLPVFSFMDTFRHLIYQFPEDAAPEFPERADCSAVCAVFSENGLRPGRTVLLVPFSYSIPSLPADFWKRLCSALKAKNYDIAVNVGGEREENLLGYVSVRLSFAEIMNFMEMAGTVIGMRSGFFDITAQAQCKRIILYPRSAGKKVDWNSTDISFCSLRAMGLCGNAIEMEVTDTDLLIHQILENL